MDKSRYDYDSPKLPQPEEIKALYSLVMKRQAESISHVFA